MKNYAALFESHIGRHLKKWEAAIIMPLERLRMLRRNCHVVILDPDGRDSRPLLLEYLRWLIHNVNPWAKAFVFDRTKAELKSALLYTRSRIPEIFIAGSRTPDACRGLNYDYAMLLSADAYPHHTLRRIITAVSAPIMLAPHPNLLIIHCRKQIPYRDIPQIYIIEPRVPDPPQRHPSRPPIPPGALDALIAARGPDLPLVLEFEFQEKFLAKPRQQ